MGDIGLDLLVECFKFLNTFLTLHIFLSFDLLFVCRAAVHSSTLTVFKLEIFFHDVLLGYSSKMSLVFIVSLDAMVDIVSVGDICTVKRFNCFEVDGPWTFDNIFKTVSKTVAKTIRHEQISYRVGDLIVRNIEEN